MKQLAQLPAVCEELQKLQRQRVQHQKTCLMIVSRMESCVADTLGYYSGMEEESRVKLRSEARDRIKKLMNGEEHGLDPSTASLVQNTSGSLEPFELVENNLKRAIVRQAKLLPAAEWADAPERRGFGILQLGIVVGECGDLNNYAAPGKVWRRMGVAPYRKGEDNLMGSTWKRRAGGKIKGAAKLTAAEWEDFGYNPRRRSIVYLIGESLLKGNQTGPYRRRYDEAKERAAENWQQWKDEKAFKLHCHLHGMLLASKLLLKDLWIFWTQ